MQDLPKELSATRPERCADRHESVMVPGDLRDVAGPDCCRNRATDGPMMTVVATNHDKQQGATGAADVTVCGMAGATLIRVVGNLGVDVVPALRTALETSFRRHSWVIMDLDLVTAVDRIALNTLVTGGFAARRRGGALLLVAKHAVVGSALETARMGHALRRFPTVPQAMSAVPPEESSRTGTIRQRGSAGCR
ncbi:STAS domain-containing protein [Actinoplanes auranticolor]|nr:STAS domain-containing protein [Actinoplanes auranticolor]